MTIIAIAALGMVLTYATAGVVSIQQTNSTIKRELASSGNIASINVGIYSDYACSQSVESINWGDIAPGEEINKIIHLKNTGVTPITLCMTANNWNPPSANGPITLTWDKEAANLNPDEITTATLTLAVSEDITDVTTFSVMILITGLAK